MNTSLTASLLGSTVLVLAAACTSNGLWRTGPDFDDEFPDHSELVTTQDPAAVRTRLAFSRLPATDEHHQRLLALLRAQPSIDAPHLVLLAEAVALGNPSFVVRSPETYHAYAARGESPFAPVVDELLSEGAGKLQGVDRRWLGELIGLTQSDATLAMLADKFLPALDDGSEQALDEVLEGMRGSPATVPFVCGYLAPRGALDGPRGWSAVRHVAFDSDRVAVIQALAARNATVDGARLVAAIGTLSFDTARRQGLDAMVPKAKPVSAEIGRAVVASFSFDSGRETAVAALAKDGGLQLDDNQLVEFVSLCSFDSGRLQCVKVLAPHLHGEVSFDAADRLLREFSFDSSRLAALEAMAPRWLALPAGDRSRLAMAFSFEASRTRALQRLMK